jgi:hypothetical protein
LLTSTGQTGKPIFMVIISSPNDERFWDLTEKFEFTVSNPKNSQKVGVVYGFPANSVNQ